ncbi:ATP-binding cassette sub-family G member 1-like isoform X3 [Daphnia pulicaria]|uniref:ATP-binding cassette sub-family G member 1-like isoform X3 n=1 Tax=Daphnia pulicaria TaxID=35523 RepID=UPI001EEAB428|nr:ATP-binding cassette sub-family G member 1-like isoform X3 [Daphnia pulicaria]
MSLSQQETINLKVPQELQASTSLDFSFRDVSYTVGKGKNVKTILHQMSGIFKSGQLTAILGPSGAGKTSLMNILAGLKTSGIDGHVEVNGETRELKTFRKQSVYITQQDHLLQDLTVYEYMMSAAHLKLGNKFSDKEKKSETKLVMKTLGLINSKQTRISCLSGGECKRLSIGVELFNNPSILFLDEPTSGLDSSSSMQCVTLLREIARSGRTVVATIHQPSSRLLDQFDQLYIVASGSCIYQGPVESLVPYLKIVNLNCPSYHNPADFVMDVASGEYGDVLHQLTSIVKNGRLIYNQDSESGSIAIPSHNSEEDLKTDNDKKKPNKKNRTVYAVPFHTQVYVLLNRTWRTIWREKMLTKVRFFTHVVFGVFFGLMFGSVGNDAAYTLNNAGMLFFNLIFIVFTAAIPTAVTFPLERKVLAREHLNNWYSLKAYYIAKTLADIPFQILFPTVNVVIIYIMTKQPMSMERFIMLLVIVIGISLAGQGIGLFFGAGFDIQEAVFLAPTMAIPLLIFAGFFIKLSAVPPYLNWLTYVSFFRYGFEGSMLAIYYERPPIDCFQPYCYFRSPNKLLQEFDMDQGSYLFCIAGLLFYFVAMRFAGYFLLRFKLKSMR